VGLEGGKDEKAVTQDIPGRERGGMGVCRRRAPPLTYSTIGKQKEKRGAHGFGEEKCPRRKAAEKKEGLSLQEEVGGILRA